MRAFVLLVVLATSVPAVGQDLARDLLDRFHLIEWNSVSAAAPAEPGFLPGPWGGPAWPDNDGLACFRFHRESAGFEWNSDYYALDTAAPACRLMRFRARTRVLDPYEATAVYDAIRNALESELGASRDPGQIHAWGAGYWRNTRQWDRDGIRILLFLGDDRDRPARIVILAEHQEVLRAQERASALRYSQQRDLPADVEAALHAEVGDVLPGLNEMLSGEPSESRFAAPDLQTAIESLLGLATRAAGDRRAALLLAADRVAHRLSWKLQDGLDAPLGSLRTATSANLHFELDHYGGWIYKHDLLGRVWREHEQTRWGEFAFLLLQEGGWYFGKSCPADSEFFPSVIENGERFLDAHPNSPRRLETVYQLAQAYEDWWNAGLAPLEDVYSQISRSKYEPRMQEMRLKAIASYEQVLQAEPQSVPGLWASLRVPRLMLSLHTDGFRFADSCH